jgi:hypothetical protein
MSLTPGLCLHTPHRMSRFYNVLRGFLGRFAGGSNPPHQPLLLVLICLSCPGLRG